MPCDGKGCTLELPQLCHVTGLVKVEHPDYIESSGVFLCPLCIATGRLPYVDSESDDELPWDDDLFCVMKLGALKV